MTTRELLHRWLSARLAPDALARLTDGGRRFALAFSGAGRLAGDAPLDLDADERAAAVDARSGWDPSHWTRADAARAWLVLGLGDGDALDRTFRAAGVEELASLYKALPLLPEPDAHVARCAEGVRTNMTTVFCAVAHRNPYPREHLPDAAWNQMVLKALFVGVALDPILGLDERANPELARMLSDYAHERWAAGRAVSPELWRCVGPYADEAALADLARVLREGTTVERQAATLALRACPAAGAAGVLKGGGDPPPETTWSALAPEEA